MFSTAEYYLCFDGNKILLTYLLDENDLEVAVVVLRIDKEEEELRIRAGTYHGMRMCFEDYLVFSFAENVLKFHEIAFEVLQFSP